MVSPMRLYAAAIAIVSGGYSLWQVSASETLGIDGWAMLVVGAVVLGHGVVLLTEEADRIGSVSGVLMIGYAIVMLAIQLFRELGVIGDGMGMGMMTPGMDVGMVSLAILMLISGLIMERGPTQSGQRM